MPLLHEELQRRKQADAGVGTVISKIVPEVIEEGVNQLMRKLTAPPRLIEKNKKEEAPVKMASDEEDAATYRNTRTVTAPVSPAELAVSIPVNVGSIYGTQRLLNKLPFKSLHEKAPTLAESAGQMYGPKYIPLTMLTSTLLNHARAPLDDPLYRSGKRSYMKSFSEGVQGSADALGEQGSEARKRYGAAGIPLQMMHGVLNPISSLVYGGRSVRNLLRSKQGSDLAIAAEKSIIDALNESNPAKQL